jgi:hypothetical protein
MLQFIDYKYNYILNKDIKCNTKTLLQNWIILNFVLPIKNYSLTIFLYSDGRL